jgi:hypothetical protein
MGWAIPFLFYIRDLKKQRKLVGWFGMLSQIQRNLLERISPKERAIEKKGQEAIMTVCQLAHLGIRYQIVKEFQFSCFQSDLHVGVKVLQKGRTENSWRFTCA